MFRRHLLTTTAVTALAALGLVAPAHAAVGSPSAGPLADCLTLSTPTCYAPRQFLTAYGIAPLLDRGIDGHGETIVMPEFVSTVSTPGATDIRADLARFDGLFGLPPARLQVITRFAGASTPYLANGEEAGDVEVAHEVAPGAAIRVVLLPETDVTATYIQALRYAASLGTVVSVTAGYGEMCVTSAQVMALNAALRVDELRHVTVVAASGDSGAAIERCSDSDPFTKGVNLPAADPLVLSVGGTELQADHTTGQYIGETAWNTPPPVLPLGVVASNGGFSGLFTRPAYQDGVPGAGAMRGVPDVAADADQATGPALAFETDGGYAIVPGGGTSAGAPFWAGIMALADQYAGRPLGFVNPAIYAIGRSHLYHSAFHDITEGGNTAVFPSGTVTGYSAGPGWDPVTGWGSPDAQVLVPLLGQPSISGSEYKSGPEPLPACPPSLAGVAPHRYMLPVVADAPPRRCFPGYAGA
jgi:subtilase family serine protease